MSLSDELVDSLLSGYLDDALEDHERAQIETLLHDDSDLMARLNQMRLIQDALKRVASQDSGIKLDAGFSDRVMQAAVARAREVGLADDHPLVKVSEQPMISLSQAQGSSIQRIAAVLVGLAATIGLAIFIGSRTEPNALHNSVAIAPSAPGSAALDPSALTVTPELPSPDSLVTSEDMGPQRSPATDSALARVPSVDKVETPDSNSAVVPQIETAKLDRLAGSAMPSVSEPGIANRNLATPNPANTTPRSTSPVNEAAPLVVMSRSEASGKLAAVLVLDVRQTEEGRRAKAVSRALREAAISSLDNQPITQAIAGTATQAVGVGVDEAVSLMYLEAPAKSLDQFYMNLLSDQAGIDSVSMTLATNAPILQTIEGAELDPTAIHHSGSAVELVSQDGSVENLVEQLDQLDFAQLNREMATMMNVSNGPDITAKILVVIR
ncbi:hypothetical protein Pla22_31190 [Rubripirellula amarantea]|uniref:Zinc-finger domain-containing protein n=1 Tax=Rubripirellula amarantea TaxID=2527999 RepID=A0A5C5WIH2_9BACT|nr:hypothetical protein [Rubripirellula amarantea]TWT50377.1 hypothetical protein Pla22_31190 [Rubripirellula amarantea]